MHSVAVEFEQVMHVQRRASSRFRAEHTVFSFMSKDGYVPYVTIPGSPLLYDGMRVVALLREAGDWNSLIGWRDQKSGEVAGPDVREAFRRMLGMWVFGAVFAAMVLSVLEPGMSLPGAAIVVLAFLPVYLVYREHAAWRQAKTERAALERLPSPNAG